MSISKFTDAAWGNTTVDFSGALVLKGQGVAPPRFMAANTPAGQLPHRYGFYELAINATAAISHYHVQWAQDTPTGSKVVMLTGSMDYKSSPGNLAPATTLNGTPADISLPKPAQHLYVTFQLFSGIGAAASDAGASPRVTGISVSTPDSASLTVAPQPPPAGWADVGSQAQKVQRAPSSATPAVGTFISPTPAR